MRGRVAFVVVLAVGCAHEPRVVAPQQPRCLVRVSDRGTFVDGERMSRSDAVAHCKRAPRGAVLVTEYLDEALAHEVAEVKSALEREGVRAYVQGPICYSPEVDGCRPRAGATRIQPKTTVIVPTEPTQTGRESVPIWK